MSPYIVTVAEVVTRFATTPERCTILAGWLEHRQAMRSVGIERGFQWLDGSFLEDKERLKGTPPNDLDLVAFFHRPDDAQTLPEFQTLFFANPSIFSRSTVKARYHLDLLQVDMDADVETIVKLTGYYGFLFSHTRAGQMWKGMLQVSQDDDKDESSLLASLQSANLGTTP